MRIVSIFLCLFATVCLVASAIAQAQPVGTDRPPEKFVVINFSQVPGVKDFERIAQTFKPSPGSRIAVGIGGIFSYFNSPPEKTQAALSEFLRLARQYEIPVVVQLDGEQWWGARPDLWNWWDPKQPGYDPNNRKNVEWSGWKEEDAVRIGWRNWGRQIRVLPPPNLMSPRYREACHIEMKRLIPIVLDWWKSLPDRQKYLLIGIKLGWESSLGVNTYYYPNGNALADQPAEQDPKISVHADELPGRGFAPIGYAAVRTAGLSSSGDLKEADLAEVVRRHLEDLSKIASEMGVPRDHLFTHCGGWKENELLYRSALNRYACPGWSFYKYARDPKDDTTVQSLLKQSDAPYWGAVEWLPVGAKTEEDWLAALKNTLQISRCRYLCIYNWSGIEHNEAALSAIRSVR